MIPRHAAPTLLEIARGFPVVVITGPRQSGKTTLARAVFDSKPYVTLEDPDERAFAESDPRRFLSRFPDGAVVDEVQRCTDLLSYLQGRVDADKRVGEFVLTGSQQFGLLSGITQSLAGRSGLVQLLPFSIRELQDAGRSPASLDELLWRGFYPPLYDREIKPQTWQSNYVMTYLERDVRQLSSVRDLSLFQRFLKMCAARCGQLLNLTSLADDCGISHVTARNWLSVLEAGYVVFLLPPHHRNFGKRLVKTPKLYFYDTGLAAYLVGIHEPAVFTIHPLRGFLFESFVISEFAKHRFNAGRPADLHFWRDNIGNEIDLVIEQAGKIRPIEIKSGQTLTDDQFAALNKWRRYAGTDSETPWLIYGGTENYSRGGVEVFGWSGIPRA